MIKSIMFLIIIVLPAYKLAAQPIPLEVMAGNENYWYQHVIARKFTIERFGFSHVSSLHSFYDSEKTDEIMSQSYLTYSFVKGINLAVGTFYATAPGISPSLAIQFYHKSGDFFMMFVPRIDVRKNGSYDAMAFVEYRPAITNRIALYSRVQGMSNFSDDHHHNRSYQNFRIGFDFKKVQAGFALNVDEYGKEKRTHHNTGIFIRTEL